MTWSLVPLWESSSFHLGSPEIRKIPTGQQAPGGPEERQKHILGHLLESVSWILKWSRKMEAREDVTRDSACHPQWKI